MNPAPVLITLFAAAFVSGVTGFAAGWLARGYRTEIARMGR